MTYWIPNAPTTEHELAEIKRKHEKIDKQAAKYVRHIDTNMLYTLKNNLVNVILKQYPEQPSDFDNYQPPFNVTFEELYKHYILYNKYCEKIKFEDAVFF